MDKLILSLAIIVGALALGQALHLITGGKRAQKKADIAMKNVLNVVLVIATPIITLAAFWIVDFSNISLVALPFMGAAALGFGSLLGILASKILGHNKLQTGSMFCCGSSTNFGSIGGLLCFAFFGEIGYSFAVMYCLFLTPCLYLLSFPGAAYYSDENSDKSLMKRLMGDKVVIIFFISLIVGVALNLLGIERPAFLGTVNEYLIPVSSFFMVMSLGYTMRFSQIKHYPKEIAAMSAIKYIINPILIIGIAYLLGLNNYGDGTLFKVLIVLSALPVGFNALIPMNIYKLEVNLGNSCWIVTTLSLVVVIPLVYFLVIH